MKTLRRTWMVLMSLVMALPIFAEGEEADTTASESKVEFTVGADLVSSYVWRGARQTGASFQPSLGVSFKGLSLSAWGSTDFRNVINELDWCLGYEVGGFSVCLTDYFGPYEDGSTPKYFASKSHIIEATLGYDFSAISQHVPIYFTWNTNIVNDEDEAGKERFSTYFEIGYPLTLKAVTLDFALGFTPWEGMYSTGFNMVNASITASKDIKITEHYSLPIFAQVVLNPNTEKIYGVFGISF